MHDFNRVTTYESDLPLFYKLGLEPFDVEVHSEHYLGEIKSDESYIKIWVKCEPAQFFKFEIFDADGEQKYKASTGSGTLANFWPIAEKMMNNMFVVKAIVNGT